MTWAGMAEGEKQKSGDRKAQEHGEANRGLGDWSATSEACGFRRPDGGESDVSFMAESVIQRNGDVASV